MSERVDAVVVGGGIAGLVSGLVLARGGLQVTILERAGEPGGCVRLHTVAGLRLDRGAESLAAGRPVVADLVAAMNLPVVAPSGRPSWLYHRGGAAPMPTRSLLGIPAHPWARDVRRIIGVAGAARASADLLFRSKRVPPRSLGAVVSRRVGRRVAERLIAPITAGVYSRQPDEIDADDVLPALRAAIAQTGSLTRAVRTLVADRPPAGGAVAGIDGGIGLLTAALATAFQQAGGRLDCAQAVTGLGSGAHGWEVTTDGPDPRSLAAPLAVIATPIGQTRTLLAQATSAAGPAAAVRTAPVEVVTLVVDCAALDAAPRGTGLLVAPRVPDVRAKALTHATAKWPWLAAAAGPGRHVLRLSYAAGAAPETGDVPVGQALADASALLAVPLGLGELVDHRSVHYPDQLTPRPGTPSPAAFPGSPGLAVTGSARTGPGLAAVIADATDTANRLLASI